MLVPQSLAYALLAGLPPIAGLYASIIPVMIYGLLGSARVLTLGPTAITSVMTLGTIGAISVSTGIDLSTLALTLALFLGGCLSGDGDATPRFYCQFAESSGAGWLCQCRCNYHRHQSVAAFIRYQLRAQFFSAYYPLAHNSKSPADEFHHIDYRTMRNCSACYFFVIHWMPFSNDCHCRNLLRFTITRSGALVLVMLSIAIVYGFDLNSTADVAIIGTIPSGFPELTLSFDFTHWQPLLLGCDSDSICGVHGRYFYCKIIDDRSRTEIESQSGIDCYGCGEYRCSTDGRTCLLLPRLVVRRSIMRWVREQVYLRLLRGNAGDNGHLPDTFFLLFAACDSGCDYHHHRD